MPRSLVVGAVVVDAPAGTPRVLAARRSRPSELAGRWEFPGGKVEPGETPQQALVRELEEELGVTVRVGVEVTHPAGAWPISERHELRLFVVTVVAGEPCTGDDHDALCWLTPDALATVDWLPADAAALAAVQAAVEAAARASGLPWPLAARTVLRDRLLATYASRRGYHDGQHLAEVLERIAELGGADDVELVLAAWFHDAVYDGNADEEERSAQLAEAELEDSDVDVAEVARLVRLTLTHDPAPGDGRGAVLCDADLAILAAPPGRYAEYVDGVRADFAHVEDEAFRLGRLAVLEELIGRDALFRTDHARTAWEPRARHNLAAEIARLRG